MTVDRSESNRSHYQILLHTTHTNLGISHPVNLTYLATQVSLSSVSTVSTIFSQFFIICQNFSPDAFLTSRSSAVTVSSSSVNHSSSSSCNPPASFYTISSPSELADSMS